MHLSYIKVQRFTLFWVAEAYVVWHWAKSELLCISQFWLRPQTPVDSGIDGRNTEILHWFIALAPSTGILEIYGFDFSRGGVVVAFLLTLELMKCFVDLGRQNVPKWQRIWLDARVWWGWLFHWVVSMCFCLAERQQQKSGSVLIVKIKNFQEPIEQLVVPSVICAKIEQCNFRC